MAEPTLITTRGWVTSTSCGAVNVVMSMTESTEKSTLTSQDMERRNKTMTKSVKEKDVTEFMMKEYPTLMNSIKNHMNTCFSLMAKKQMDYGMGNIAMNGNKKLALLGIMIRINDKVQRALNILEKDQDPNNESLEDTAQDITNYGAIFNTVLNDEWKK
jgi:transcriptional regulator with GAF, ATPase, and Fis domain